MSENRALRPAVRILVFVVSGALLVFAGVGSFRILASQKHLWTELFDCLLHFRADRLILDVVRLCSARKATGSVLLDGAVPSVRVSLVLL